MIRHEELENGNLVTVIEFGGDVLVGSRFKIDKTSGMLTLSNLDERVEIGKELPEFTDANLADMDKLVLLIFGKVESIDVVIGHLNKIREGMTLSSETEGGKE